MLWLKARSVMALGMMTATRKGFSSTTVGFTTVGGSRGATSGVCAQELISSAKSASNTNLMFLFNISSCPP